MTRLSAFVANRSMAELYDTYWVPSALDMFARGLAAYVNTGDRVLDLACGTGIVAGYAAERSGRTGSICGYDPTPDLLEAARSKEFAGAPIEWLEGYGETMPFSDAEFDVVLCHQGLQYLTDREQTFAEIRRVLKPDGWFHAGVWACAADQSAFGFVEDALAKHFGPEQKPVHAWSFGGLAELRRLAETAELRVERLEAVEKNWQFGSVQEYVDVQIACAGRTDDEGRLALGLVDLDDERGLPAIDAFGDDAHRGLSRYVEREALVAPFVSDELSARK